MKPFIDVSIVTYNASKWLEKFFGSLLAQNYPLARLNLYIHDNGSTDDSVEQCEAFINLKGRQFGQTLLTKGSNEGFGTGHNYNFSKGHAPFFLVTNVDLEFEPEAIDEIIHAARNDHENQFASFEFRQKPYEHPKYYHPLTLETRWSSSACIIFRREAFAEIGGYEEKIFLYGEDVEISYRLRDHGYRLMYCPKAVCWHYSYEYEKELKPAQYFGSVESNMYIRLRYGSWWNIFSGFIIYFAQFFKPASIPKCRTTLFKNLMRIFKNTPYFLLTRKRSQIQFIFMLLDYDIRRRGDFYTSPKLSDFDSLPLVSVITRTIEGKFEWFKQALASVCQQTYPNIELVVIEDGSDTAREYVESLENIKTLYHSIPKSGRCVAGNKGLSLASGAFITFLDDDDLFYPDHIEILATELLKHPEIGATYAGAFCVKTTVTSTLPLRVNETVCAIQVQPFSRPRMWVSNFLSIQSVLFRRSLYEKYGGFDVELNALEDWNLWTKYSATEDFMLIDKVTSLYRIPADDATFIERQRFLDKYYSMAKAKQSSIMLAQLSIEDISKFVTTLHTEEKIERLKRGWLRRFVLSHSWAFKLYKFYESCKYLCRIFFLK